MLVKWIKLASVSDVYIKMPSNCNAFKICKFEYNIGEKYNISHLNTLVLYAENRR